MTEARRLRMVRDTLAGLPEVPVFPRTLALRGYEAGDDAAWNQLIAAAYPELPPDPDPIARIFGAERASLADRMGLLVVPLDGPDRAFVGPADRGRIVGTATAWHGDGPDAAMGRLHWVAIAPELQGGGLGRPLVVWALRRLAELGHASAYLMTEDFRLPAIGLYRSLGFRPDPQDAGEAAAWAELLPLLAGGT